jgi:hypothetical protein
MPEIQAKYPVSLAIDYPERLNRLTTFFRLVLVIPILIILELLAEIWFGMGEGDGWKYGIAGGGVVFLPTLLMILFRKKYPRWWFDWNLAFTRFSLRVWSYFSLLRDEYPSTDDEQAVHLDIPYPDAEKELGRGMPLVKWFLALPHYIVLYFLFIAAILCTVFAWFVILFTGRYPRGMFDFVVGIIRWGTRVLAYMFLLTTDCYPPFTLKE